MNFKFAKTLLMGSVMTMGAFGLVACGDDSSSSGPETNPNIIPDPGPSAAEIDFKNLANVDLGGGLMKFTGSISFNYDNAGNENTLVFNSIEFKIGYVGGSTPEARDVNINIIKPATFPTDRTLNLNEMGVSVDMKNDAAFTECGNYMLYISVTASNGTEDLPGSAQIPFSRPEALCKVVDPVGPTPVEKTEVPMTAYIVENMSTNIAPGLSFATGAITDTATADVLFTKAAGDVSMSSATGYTFTPITNGTADNDYDNDYEVGFWPEDVKPSKDVNVSDFKYNEAALKPSIAGLIENSNQIYIAAAPTHDKQTGAGIYAVAISTYKEGNNRDYNLTVKVYKVQ